MRQLPSWIGIGIGLCLALSAGQSAALPPQVVSLSASDETGDPGSSIVIAIDVTGLSLVDQLGAAKFSVQVDPSLLTPTGASAGALLSGIAADDLLVNLFADRAEISLLTETPVSLAAGELLEVSFQVNAAALAGQQSEVSLVGVGDQDIVLLADANDPPPGLVADVTSGTFTVGEGVSCLAGDATGDLTINAADAVVTLRIVAELITNPTPAQACGADANADQEINAGDAIWILRDVVGLPRKSGATSVWARRTAAGLELSADGPIFGLDLQVAADHWVEFGAPTQGIRIEVPTAHGGRMVWVSGSSLGNRIQLPAPHGASVERLAVYDGLGKAIPVRWPSTVDDVTVTSHPNPFNPRTTVSYRVPRAGSVEVSVYDVRGQHVIDLVRADLDAGDHEVTWNGTDRVGNRVASGVYVVRVQTGGQVGSEQMLLVK